MKFLLVFLIVLSQASDAQDRTSSLKMVKSILSSNHSINFVRSESQIHATKQSIDRINDEILLNGESEFKTNQNTDHEFTSRGNILKQNSGAEYEIGIAENDINTSKIGWRFPILNPYQDQLKVYESVKTLQEENAQLQFKSLILNDLKLILTQRAQLDIVDNEIKLRKTQIHKTSEVLKLIRTIIQAGLLSEASIDPIELFIRENTIRIETLQLEAEFIKDRVFHNFNIPSELFVALDIKSIIQSSDFNTQAQRPYTFLMDSTSILLNKEQLKLANTQSKNLYFSVGADFKTMQTFDDDQVYAKLGFNWSSFHDEIPKFQQRIHQDFRPPVKVYKQEITSFKEKISEFDKKSKVVLENVLQKIRLGQGASIFELTSLYQQDLNLKLTFYRLRNLQYQNLITSLINLNQLEVQ